MTANIDMTIMNKAESLYDPKLAYHNFNHIHYVFAAADDIIERCRRNRVELDENVVYLALLFHDAGFIEDHVAMGFNSKEAYSARIAERILDEHDYEEEFIRKVSQAIIKTHCDERCDTNEDRAVKRADLSGLADSYQVFLDNAILLKQEYELLHGRKISWDDWKTQAIDRLLLFLSDTLELTDEEFDGNGESLFQRAVTANIERFRNEPAPHQK